MSDDKRQPLADSLLNRRYIDNDYKHIMPEGTDWPEALRPEYWAHSFDKLRPGDTITVHSSDHHVAFEVLIEDINPRCSPIYMVMQYRPLYPADLVLPAPPSMDAPKYHVRTMRGSNLFQIVNNLGDVVRDRMGRSDALDACLALNEADRDARPPLTDIPSGPMPGTRREHERDQAASRQRAKRQRDRQNHVTEGEAA